MSKGKHKKILKAEYGSDKTPIRLGNTEIPCYVLEDGTRVLSGRAIQKAIGYEGSSGDWLKKFVATKNISQNINPDIIAGLLEPIEFERKDAGGSQPITYGYEATKLIDLCDALIDLKKAGVLKENQLVYAEQAEMIIRAVAKVGIIALVDEATGYQQIRDKDALQKFLEKFLVEERGKWIPTFPDEFFEMIFKMKGLTWTTANKGKKPQWIGHWINNFVYSRMAPKVLAELRKLNPKNDRGNRKSKHTQWIDVDYGHPKLIEHLNLLVAFALAVGYNETNWKRMIERARPKFDQTDGSAAQEIPFNDID
ncbi:MAG: P63C domain-containing protein [Taibaiella sp.]|nr:P63C domain-containing protein [Taibaiella sp.]